MTAAAMLLSVGATAAAQSTSSDFVEFKPGKLKFSSVLMGRCKPRKIDAINTSGSTIQAPVFQVEEGGEVFSLQKRGKCPDPLDPGETCRVYVNFCPGMFGRYKGTLVFSASDRQIQMTGSGTQGGR